MKNWSKSEVLKFHLSELKGDLEKLLFELQSGETNNVDLYIRVAHMYHHLNTAWNGRAYDSLGDPRLESKEVYFALAEFPNDLHAWDWTHLPSEITGE